MEKKKAFLAPLPVGKIPMIGEKACETLLSMGIHKVGDLQQQSLKNLERVFGRMGKMMWEKANGIDLSPVVPYQERKSISSEHTFQQDTLDIPAMQQLLVSMTEQLTYRLRQENKQASSLAVKIRYSNFETVTRQMAVPPTNSDTVLFPLVKELFAKSCQKRPVRLIGVRLGKLSEGAYQAGLFDDHERSQKLYQALDKLNQRFGTKTVSRAISMGISIRDFNPFSGETGEQ